MQYLNQEVNKLASAQRKKVLTVDPARLSMGQENRGVGADVCSYHDNIGTNGLNKQEKAMFRGKKAKYFLEQKINMNIWKKNAK